MAIEVGIPYELIGPDGTRIVFNDSTDADFVGLLDGESGVTGLDSAEVRESADNIVEGDGGIHGNFFYGRRPVVLSGIIWPDPDMATVVARQEKVERATNALRADATLRWTPSGSVRRRLLVRRQQPLRITQRRPKAVQIPLVSSRAIIESDALHTSILAISGSAIDQGFVFDLAFDLYMGGGSAAGSITINNAGTADAAPIIRVDGPVTNPILANATTGEELYLTYTLAAGEYLTLDFADDQHTVKFMGTSDRYYAFDPSRSTWWKLKPGNNDVRLRGSSYAAPAQLTVIWRDAWP